jgi:hypothetical protein
MGRPPLEEDKKKKGSVQVFVTLEEREHIEELADDEQISVSEWGRQAVREKLARSKRRRRRQSMSAATGPA